MSVLNHSSHDRPFEHRREGHKHLHPPEPAALPNNSVLRERALLSWIQDALARLVFGDSLIGVAEARHTVVENGR